MYVFFFSSRRRHTRYWRDWSSDVCSSDLLLADEINRAPAKVQSALLEVMQERQVTIGGQTHPLPAPFPVLATQNPIEAEGAYPLPEAPDARFLFKLLGVHPAAGQEGADGRAAGP